ncbi:unnamed protein product [Mycena citricolor]|uniref:Major facilitator superfamily (MFS) profile domain-containing protein n=1 Tax=Mycena citricolor TaxID=2018698 RepID=A0AAD2HJF8_9AGAR|nr:unnamed protein product [Mycena citricolor]
MQSPTTPRRRTAYTPRVTDTWSLEEEGLPLIEEKREHEEKADEQYESCEYLSGAKLIVLMFALGLSVFLVALDNTIIDTAVPSITDTFHSLSDVGWYSSSYLLTTASTQLLFGKLYTHFPIKLTYMLSIALFELGSLLCGAAPNSALFILGRAVAGVGNAGIFSGGLVIIAHTVPLPKRPLFSGLIGGLGGVGSVAGPLLGGVITARLSFRWCFYLSLPVGLVTLVLTGYLLRVPVAENNKRRAELAEFDPWGNVVFVPAMVSLLLAVQWGGSSVPWSSPLILSLLAMSLVLLIVFALIQIRAGEHATIPPRILSQRSIWSCSIYALCIGGAFNIITMCLPIWFQVIHTDSPETSGIHTLPVILSLVAGCVVAGALIGAIGFYAPFMMASALFTVAGSSLLGALLTVESTSRTWLVPELLCGFGVGLGLQQPMLAAQTVLELRDVAVGTAVVMFANTLGGALFVAVAQSAFTSSLVSRLVLAVPGVKPEAVLQAGATNLKDTVRPGLLADVLVEYNASLAMSFWVAMVLGAIAFLGSCAIEWKSVKARKVATI